MVRYDIDCNALVGLCSPKSSVGARRKYAWSLFSNCLAQEINFSSVNNRICKKLYGATALLAVEKDAEVTVSLLCLTVVLLQAQNCEAELDPTSVTSGIFFSLVAAFVRLKSQITVDSNGKDAAEAAVVEVKQHGIRAKRKLSSASQSSSQRSNEAESQNSDGASQSAFDDDSYFGTRSGTGESHDRTIVDRVRGHWPNLTEFLVGPSASTTLDPHLTVDLAVGLVLAITNRILVTLIQQIFQVEAEILSGDSDPYSESSSGDLPPQDESTISVLREAKEQKLQKLKSLLVAMQNAFKASSKESLSTVGRPYTIVLEDSFEYELYSFLFRCLRNHGSLFSEIELRRKRVQCWLSMSVLEATCYNNTAGQV
jgi:hypothetical protein